MNEKYLDVITAQSEYIKLLEAELDEIVPFMNIHHWASTRVVDGEQARKKIADAFISLDTVKDMGSFEEVRTELEKAVKKFPTWPTDPFHALAILGEEFGELTQAIMELTYEPGKSTIEDVHKEALHMAAMAIRFITSLDKYKYQRGEQHEQTF